MQNNTGKVMEIAFDVRDYMYRKLIMV